MVLPCHVKEKSFSGLDDQVRDDCNTDLKKADEYFGSANLVIYYNEGMYQG